VTTILGARELVAQVLDKGLCIGCGACVGLCPYFKNRMGRTTMPFDCDLARGRCYAYCPKIGGAAVEPAPYRQAMAARAGEGARKDGIQDGGVVTALMTFALESDFIDGAVLTGRDGLVPVPRLVTRADEVAGCAGSKYTAAPTLAALNRGIEEGFGRLGVVATPCQASAVANLRRNPMESADFTDPVALVVGLFCTWALDTRRFMAFLGERMDVSGIRSMDIPPPPANVLVVTTEHGDVEFPLDDIRPLVPDGCHACADMTAEQADISVGAMEGRPGWNTLIIRSDTGEKLVEQAAHAGWLETGELPAANLEHLMEAAANKRRRARTEETCRS
jgi:coenzyme F420 hydrogenase subunit beta